MPVPTPALHASIGEPEALLRWAGIGGCRGYEGLVDDELDGYESDRPLLADDSQQGGACLASSARAEESPLGSTAHSLMSRIAAPMGPLWAFLKTSASFERDTI